MDKELFKKKFAANLRRALEYLEIPERERNATIRNAIKKSIGSAPTDQAVRLWLDGETMPQNHHLVALCDELGLSVAFILTGRGPILAGSEAVDINGNVIKIAVTEIPVLSEKDIKQYLASDRAMILSSFDTVTITHQCGVDTFGTPMPDNSMSPRIRKGEVVAIDPDYPGLEDLENCDKPVAVLDKGAIYIGTYRSGSLWFDNEVVQPKKLTDESNIFGCVVRIAQRYPHDD